MHRRLAIFVHSGRADDKEKRSEELSLRLLSRAMEIVREKADFETFLSKENPSHNDVIDRRVLFFLEETKKGFHIRCNEKKLNE